MAESESTEVIEASLSAIGDRLCRTAIWHEDRCNWFGHCAEEMDDTTMAITPMVGTLEADLYAGSSGVGLFLASLAAHTHDETHRRTAVAALRRSLAAADRLASIGLYSGRVGVAHAVVRGARRLGDAALLGEGLALARLALADILAAPVGDAPIDVIAGLAGTIQALIGLTSSAGGDDFGAGAQKLAQQLLARGHRDDGGAWRWPEHAREGADTPLSGLSHGAAGIAVALLEAHHASGDATLREAADGAFEYERSLYDPAQRNWLDLRSWVTASAGPTSCGATWCHGAPGIALSRLRAIALGYDNARTREDAEIAVATTRDELARRQPHRDVDATLCHGTCGLAETLLVAGRVLGRDELVGEAHAIATAVAHDVMRGEVTSGVPSGAANPSLMLGTAGVGWFFLRILAPRETPSLLTSAAIQEGAP